jgi:putative N6-adenine-specific DNA methylase
MTTNNRYFATVARGLEAIAAQELEKLGAEDVTPTFTGVYFTGNQELLYRVNLWTRICFRILMFIAEIKANNEQQLYNHIQTIDWEEYFTPEHTFSVHSTGGNRNLNHTHFTALQIKNAIVDQQQLKFKQRSYIETENPDFIINAHIVENLCILNLDSSGSSLHRRGYRPAMGLAPLKESLASALIELSEWTPNLPFLDPLCGSGTLPIEATLKSLNIAPGLYRESFGFQNWQNFDIQLWQKLREEAEDSQKNELQAPIIGSDNNKKILEQAYSNAQGCHIENKLTLLHQKLSEIEAPSDQGIIICNPPYGKRIGEEKELGNLYKLLGDVFKQRFKGWTAYVLTGNKELAKQIGLKTSRRTPVYNGALPCIFSKYELY